MKLRDTTVEANSGEDMADYFLYHAQSAGDRWAIGVEQVKPGHFTVSVLMKQPEWELFGVVRYWVFEDRAIAEARYLELQRLFADIDEESPMKAVLAALPAPDRRVPGREEE